MDNDTKCNRNVLPFPSLDKKVQEAKLTPLVARDLRQTLIELSELKTDIQYLEYLKKNRIKFTLKSWSGVQQQKSWLEISHYSFHETPAKRQFNIRVWLTWYGVSDVPEGQVSLSTGLSFIAWSKALKSGVNIILNETQHQGLVEVHEQAERKLAAQKDSAQHNP